jgi:hypothetical protein
MRRYAKIASVSILMMGLLAVPNLSPATDASSNRDGDGRHRLLNAELRSKVEDLRNKIVEHREHQHNQGGIPRSLETLQTEVDSLKASLATANAQLLSLTASVKALATPAPGGGSVDPVLVELAKYVTVTPVAEMRFGLKGPHVIFHGANVHVQSGSGTTFEAGGATGRGNLIVGYNEGNGLLRVGSHNLVVGPSHTYTSTGGVVFGESNFISAKSAAVLGGLQNHADGERSSILGAAGQTISPLYPEYTIP